MSPQLPPRRTEQNPRVKFNAVSWGTCRSTTGFTPRTATTRHMSVVVVWRIPPFGLWLVSSTSSTWWIRKWIAAVTPSRCAVASLFSLLTRDDATLRIIMYGIMQILSRDRFVGKLPIDYWLHNKTMKSFYISLGGRPPSADYWPRLGFSSTHWPVRSRVCGQ